jgi:endothelin-converting enzyme/putative endopeptidase
LEISVDGFDGGRFVNLRTLALSFCLVSTFAFAQQAAQPAPGSVPGTTLIAPVLPYTPSLDVSAMDRSADPCVDLYTYSCGGWQKKNPIPPDQVSWSVYGKLYQDNLIYLRGILEQAAAAKDRDAVTQKIGDYYGACMDEAGVEKLGAKPLQPELDQIQALKSARDLAPLVASMHLDGDRTMFGSGAEQNPDDSDAMIVSVGQGGLGLPDRDYYTKDDAKSQEIRERYVQHVQKVFELLGDPPDTAKKQAATIMRMETALAKASLTRVERRDPYKTKHIMKKAELSTLAPNFDWSAYFASSQVPSFDNLNVAEPEFFKELNSQLKSTSLSDWKSYLRYHLVNSRAPYLSSAFVNENFDFYRKYLRGAKELQPPPNTGAEPPAPLR